MKITIVDYNIGNLKSVLRSFLIHSKNVYLSNNPNDISDSSHIVIPGVGSFNDGMKNLISSGFYDSILNKYNTDNNTKILGICLGMQLLSSYGDEGGHCKGLNLIKGNISKLQSSNTQKVPHVGWNDIEIKKHHKIIDNIKNKSDFYFTHSYKFEVNDYSSILATTSHAEVFNSIVAINNVIGVQFHPEKSGDSGLKLIYNFLNL
ncbi:imidazole glycerol phosphate synthase subunit HisH 1 [Alphaproteobacteria bacterium]|nr:imidazole glycerol phosphate synthase subunit HisH 1 [Alphaproteobacteria bacterium]